MLTVSCSCEPRRLFDAVLAKSARRPIEHERAAVKKARARMRKVLRGFLAAQAPGVAEQLAQALDLVAKDDRNVRRQRAMDALDGLVLDWRDLADQTEEFMAGVAVDGGSAALEQLGLAEGEAEDVMRLRSEAWARRRAAEMVGMKRDADGVLVPNPNAKWRIDDATRDMLRSTVEDAIDGGWSVDKLAEAIADAHAFSAERADMIARTEIARADVEGTLVGWEASGLVAGKQWLTAPDCCDACQELNDEIVGLRDQFSDGSDGPPAHPNCRCAVTSVFEDEMP